MIKIYHSPQSARGATKKAYVCISSNVCHEQERRQGFNGPPAKLDPWVRVHLASGRNGSQERELPVMSVSCVQLLDVGI